MRTGCRAYLLEVCLHVCCLVLWVGGRVWLCVCARQSRVCCMVRSFVGWLRSTAGCGVGSLCCGSWGHGLAGAPSVSVLCAYYSEFLVTSAYVHAHTETHKQASKQANKQNKTHNTQHTTHNTQHTHNTHTHTTHTTHTTQTTHTTHTTQTTHATHTTYSQHTDVFGKGQEKRRERKEDSGILYY